MRFFVQPLAWAAHKPHWPKEDFVKLRSKSEQFTGDHGYSWTVSYCGRFMVGLPEEPGLLPKVEWR